MKLSKLLIIAVGAAYAAAAQSPAPQQEKWMMAKTVQVSGVVLDPQGKPVTDALIAHAMLQGKDGVLPADGRFHFTTRVPGFVVRAPGYNGVYVKLPADGPLHILLKPITERLPECSDKSSCWSIGSADGHFCLAKVAEVKEARPIRDIDYLEGFYVSREKHNKVFLRHGSGPDWSWGEPLDDDVWSSVEYSERAFRAGRLDIIDARGKKSSGVFWRSLVQFGESADYNDADSASAALFDRMLDGVCMLPERTPR